MSIRKYSEAQIIEVFKQMEEGRMAAGEGRNECLNVSWFSNLWETRRKVES